MTLTASGLWGKTAGERQNIIIAWDRSILSQVLSVNPSGASVVSLPRQKN